MATSFYPATSPRTLRLNVAGNPHVNGGGTTAEGGQVSTFVFNAVQLPDGSVNGHLNYKFRFADIDIRMDIDCMTLMGNRATLKGTVTDVNGNVSSYPFIFIGAQAAFTVQDNGQGRAAPDLISDLIFPAGCDANLATYLPIRGNISIKP